MPLPPTTPKRPLGPPVLFAIDDHSIWMRTDAEAAYGMWEAFLDRVAKVGLGMLEDPSAGARSSLIFFEVARLVPDADRADLHHDLGLRVQALRDDRREEGLRPMAEARTAVAPRDTRPPSILSRLFRRAA